MTSELPSSAAALRNRSPIASVLAEALPQSGLVLEIASGTGEHAEYFARAFPGLTWQPSDSEPDALGWIEARRAQAGLANLNKPILIDAQAELWPVAQPDAALCINMVHISPWTATQGLLRGAGRLLRPGAPLILYGPYVREGVATAPSNEAFDESLRARDPRWGLRSVEAVMDEARTRELSFERLVEMPANNLTLIFRRD